jgi:hypothetical protein
LILDWGKDDTAESFGSTLRKLDPFQTTPGRRSREAEPHSILMAILEVFQGSL